MSNPLETKQQRIYARDHVQLEKDDTEEMGHTKIHFRNKTTEDKVPTRRSTLETEFGRMEFIELVCDGKLQYFSSRVTLKLNE